MREHDFLLKLEERAQEQERIIKQMPMQGLFTTTSLWLGQHPWRFLIPLALVLTLLFRFVLGTRYYEFILKLFGGFGIIFN